MLPIYGPIKDRKGYGICGEGSQLWNKGLGLGLGLGLVTEENLKADGEGEREIRLTDYYWKPAPKKCSIA
jgi:hypothetical protein